MLNIVERKILVIVLISFNVYLGSSNPLSANSVLRAAVSSSRLVSLKLLNSIVLLGKSCVYVKRAKMEDKLFERAYPTSSTMKNDPNKAGKNTRCHAPSGKPQN